MSRAQREQNLRRLLDDLLAYGRNDAFGAPNPCLPEATSFSRALFLAHSTPDANFPAICGSNQLLCPQRLANLRGVALRPDCAEAVLGTGGFVFLYAAPFRFPETGCGLLFAAELEDEHRDNGVATPFDSGGLVKAFTRPDPIESAPAFLARHELPLPDHRSYLRQVMIDLFRHPLDYLEGRDPHRPGPIGLTGGGCRRVTHEVRIPDKVFVRITHLQAAFARTALVGVQPEVENLFRWCDLHGMDFVTFDTPREDDFQALQRECLAYIRTKLLSSPRP
jgi:hypothetical protein